MGKQPTYQNQQFINLVSKHQGIVHKVCGIYCNNKQDKQDLFQEILIQLWRSFPSFKGQSKISTWIYRVALNTAISAFRKQKKQVQQQAISLGALQIADAPIDTEKEERLQFLYRAIAQLNKVEKAIIMLYLEEYDYKQIAEIIGISESNVGVKLHRIKAKLKKKANKSTAS